METTDLPKADTAASDALVITLRKPVKVAAGDYTQLVLQEPTAGQMILWDNLDGAEADIVSVSMISGLPRQAIEQIGVRDLLRASRYISEFTLVKIDDDEPEPEMVLPLRKPVTLGDVTYSELSLREPKAIEMIAWDSASGVAADIGIVATVSGVPEPVIRMIGARDFVAAASYLAHFIVPSLQHGAPS